MTTRKFAERTSVPVERTEVEIKTLLRKHGATAILAGEDGHRAQVYFVMRDRHVRFTLPLPRLVTGAEKTHQAELRRIWRALLLVIKGKIEATESGISSFERAFFAELLLPSGQTMAEWALPQLEQVYASGQMPRTLPGLPAPSDGVVDAQLEGGKP